MEFYWTWICSTCAENRSNSELKSLNPSTCKVCGNKVFAVKIYIDYLENYKKDK